MSESNVSPLTAARVSAMALEVAKRAPGASLLRNAMGNLAVIQNAEMIAWMDFGDGSVHWVEDL